MTASLSLFMAYILAFEESLGRGVTRHKSLKNNLMLLYTTTEAQKSNYLKPQGQLG